MNNQKYYNLQTTAYGHTKGALTRVNFGIWVTNLLYELLSIFNSKTPNCKLMSLTLRVFVEEIEAEGVSHSYADR